MAKFYGNVGYIVMVQTAPGIFEEQEIVREYYGDEETVGSRWESGEKINDDFSINNQISVVADGFAYENFSQLRWVEWLGTKWKVSTIRVERPRLILSLGGVYNDGQ